MTQGYRPGAQSPAPSDYASSVSSRPMNTPTHSSAPTRNPSVYGGVGGGQSSGFGGYGTGAAPTQPAFDHQSASPAPSSSSPVSMGARGPEGSYGTLPNMHSSFNNPNFPSPQMHSSVFATQNYNQPTPHAQQSGFENQMTSPSQGYYHPQQQQQTGFAQPSSSRGYGMPGAQASSGAAMYSQQTDASHYQPLTEADDPGQWRKVQAPVMSAPPMPSLHHGTGSKGPTYVVEEGQDGVWYERLEYPDENNSNHD